MRLTHDKEVDAAYIYLTDEICGPISTRSLDPSSVDGMINLDFDVNDHLVGIEVIPASKLLPPTLLSVSS